MLSKIFLTIFAVAAAVEVNFEVDNSSLN